MINLTLAAIVQLSVMAAPQQDVYAAYRQAYGRSVSTERPLVVLIGAKGCPACQRMKKSILPQVAKAGGLDRVEFTYIDLDRQRDLASRLACGKSIPQLVCFTKLAAGGKKACLVGTKDSRQVHYFINAGLAHDTNSNGLSATRDPWRNSLLHAAKARSSPSADENARKAGQRDVNTTALK